LHTPRKLSKHELDAARHPIIPCTAGCEQCPRRTADTALSKCPCTQQTRQAHVHHECTSRKATCTCTSPPHACIPMQAPACAPKHNHTQESPAPTSSFATSCRAMASKRPCSTASADCSSTLAPPRAVRRTSCQSKWGRRARARITVWPPSKGVLSRCCLDGCFLVHAGAGMSLQTVRPSTSTWPVTTCIVCFVSRHDANPYSMPPPWADTHALAPSQPPAPIPTWKLTRSRAASRSAAVCRAGCGQRQGRATSAREGDQIKHYQ
jgi:hypothetical protein